MYRISMNIITKLKKALSALIFLFFGTVLTGCSLIEQLDFANNLAVIKGKVTTASEYSPNKTNIVVVLLKQTKALLFERVSYVLADEQGDYTFNIEPGIYAVGAFVDTNNDNQYQPAELGDVSGNPEFLKLARKQTIIADISITGKFNKHIAYDAKSFDQTHLSLKNIGKIVSLNDERFKSENGSFGLWQPMDFMKKYGAGLFMLQEYNSKKIPIIFVHGANGGSADWKTIITNLDQSRFQPWLLHYPSGMRLGIISDYFVRAVNELQRKYNMNKIYVVAHSMGGLITRSFVMKYQKRYPKEFEHIKFVMTINASMMGLASANTGVNFSPLVVPSWHDMSPESDFLKVINTWPWPKTLPYYLVFSYLHGEEGDGVVELESQIPLKLQSEAKRIYGYNAGHADILENKDFLQHFNQVLDRSRAK